MRRDQVRVDREEAVREAVRGWRRGRLFPEATLAKFEGALPDDRIRLAPVWRVTVFVGVLFAVLAAAVGLAVATSLDSNALGPYCLVLGILSVAATELQQRRFRFLATGSDAATSLLSIGFLLFAWEQALERAIPGSPHGTQAMMWLAAFALFALAAERWGFALYGFASAASLLFFAGRVAAAPRIGWAMAACGVIVATFPVLDRPALPPSHRDALAAALAAALAGLCAALNPWSLEARWIEELIVRWPPLPEPGNAAKWVAAAATALFTAGVLAWGIRSRRRLVLDLGIVFLIVSLVTLRHYVHLAPLWVVLSAAGASAIAAASLLERILRRAAGATFGGFTSQPLFGKDSFLSNLSVVAAAATLSPSPAAEVPRSSNDFKGGGGGFGGAGASGGY